MKLLALDISAKNTGAALGDGLSAPELRSFSPAGQDSGETCANLMKWTSGLMREYQPEEVIIEAALLMTGSAASASTARLALELAGCVKATVWMRIGKRTHEVPVQTWRKTFLGKNPSKIFDPATGKTTPAGRVAKDQALDLCKRLGWECLGDDDRAESGGVWAHGHCFIPGGNQKSVKAMLAEARAR